MENIGIGVGLVSLSFWLFIAAVSVAGIWDGARKREQEHETLRRLLESDRELDPEIMEKLLTMTGGAGRPDQDFKVTAMWILPISPGVALLGYFLSLVAPDALYPLLGVAALLAVMGAGFWIAGTVASRWYQAE